VCIIYHGDSFIWNTGFRFVLIIFSVIITEIVTKTDDLRIIGFDWIFVLSFHLILKYNKKIEAILSGKSKNRDFGSRGC